MAEDDIAFKLAILKKSLHLNDNTCFCSIIQSSKLVLGSLLAKNNFFVQFWTKNFASSRMANCGSGLPAEWPFSSQNAIEVSDSPLPGGLWVKRLITHALCSLAYSDISWCKLFLIFTMKCLYCITMAMPWALIQVCSTPICMVQCTHLITTGGTPHLYNRGSSMLVNSLHSGENNM